ncbi:MAG: hypothetical protein NVS4B2_25110 [Chloroflexota bacterium]
MQSDELAQPHTVPVAMPHSVPSGDAHEGHESEPEHVHLPPPSIWPVTMALGAALGIAGLVFTIVVSLAGLLLMAWALIQWIQELRHEFH